MNVIGGAAGGSLPLAALALVLFAAPVAGSTGVALDLGSINVEQTLYPGSTYTLPTMGVRNPGDEPGSYVMDITHLQDQAQLRAEGDWFEFEPARFSLDPGAIQPVAVRMRIPTDAEPGEYQVLLRAALAPEGAGARIGAAAAARLTFTAEPSSTIEALFRQLAGWIVDLAPWSYVVPAVIVVAALLWLFRRRFSLRLERRTG